MAAELRRGADDRNHDCLTQSDLYTVHHLSRIQGLLEIVLAGEINDPAAELAVTVKAR